MASHPYISGAGNITQIVGFLRKNFPVTVNSETVKKLGIASKNESYVINVLQFLGLIDEQGKRTDKGHAVMTKHEEVEFRSAFEDLVRSAYSDIFDLRGNDAWTMKKDQLIGYFRSTDKTSDIIGGRQASVFVALRELAGYQAEEALTIKPKTTNSGKPRTLAKKAKPAEQKEVTHDVPPLAVKQQKGEMALTVRIEINLPAEGTPETYDAIFKSIKANLFP